MGDTSDSASGGGRWARSWIGRHWRGELGLAEAYWLNGILCNVAVFGVVWLAREAGVDGPDWPGVFRLAVWVFFVAAEAWFAVGVWRAAGRYAGPRFWAYAARLVVGLCFLLILWRIVPPGLPCLPKPLL
jgi:hypothetical protein